MSFLRSMFSSTAKISSSVTMNSLENKSFSRESKEPIIDKQKIFDEVNIPAVLCDPVDLTILENPILLPSGHCFSGRTILLLLKGSGRCPLTEKPINKEEFRLVPLEMLELLNDLKVYRDGVQAEVLAASNEEVGAIIAQYESQLKLFSNRMDVIHQNLITQGNAHHTAEEVRRTIQQIKDNLKIDLTNHEHVTYWESKGKDHRKAPDHIFKMMQKAALSYNSISDFVSVLEQGRQMGCASQFFKKAFRSTETQAVYNTDDLRSLVVR